MRLKINGLRGQRSQFTCVVDGVCPQKMGNVMSPGLPVFPVLCLQRDAVLGSRSLTNPKLKLHSILSNTLSQTHLAHLQGEEDTSTNKHKDIKPETKKLVRSDWSVWQNSRSKKWKRRKPTSAWVCWNESMQKEFLKLLKHLEVRTEGDNENWQKRLHSICVWNRKRVAIFVVLYLDAVFVAVGGASRAGALLFGEDDRVLIEENVSHAHPLPPSSPAHCQLALSHQLATLRHGDLQSHVTQTHTHTHIIRMHLSWPRAQARSFRLLKIPSWKGHLALNWVEIDRVSVVWSNFTFWFGSLITLKKKK